MSELSPPDSTPPASWFRRRLVLPFLNLLRQGLSPRQLALTVSLGTACGLIPLLGVTTLMATFLAVRLRLNVAAFLLVSHVLSPVQLLLMIPLLRWGEKLLANNPNSQLTLEKLRYYFTDNWAEGLRVLWRAELGALALWLALCIPLTAGLYAGLRPLFARLAARQR